MSYTVRQFKEKKKLTKGRKEGRIKNWMLITFRVSFHLCSMGKAGKHIFKNHEVILGSSILKCT
jgi:hypothetical protein